MTCKANRFDDDGNANTGCEVGCPAVANGICIACKTSRTCKRVTCNTGFFSSDGIATNGCETALSDDALADLEIITKAKVELLEKEEEIAMSIIRSAASAALAVSSNSSETVVEPVVQQVTLGSGAKATFAAVGVAKNSTQDLVVRMSDALGSEDFQPEVSVPASVLSQALGISLNGMVSMAASVLSHEDAELLSAIGSATKRAQLGSLEESAGNEGAAGTTPVLASKPISVTLYGADGKPMKGVQLSEPINLTIQEKRQQGAECVFWNATASAWSLTGLTRITQPDTDALICQTTHLSIFAAITAGIEKTILCTQSHLLSENALKEVFRGDWYLHEGPLTVASVLLLTLLLMALAICLERRRWKRGYRDDALFFMVFNMMDNAAAAETDTELQVAEPIMPRSTCSCFGWIWRGLCTVVALIWCVLDPLWQEAVGAMGDAWSVVVDFIQGIRELCIDVDMGSFGCFHALLYAALAKAVLTSVHLQAAVALNMRADDVAFLKDLRPADDKRSGLIAPACARTVSKLVEDKSISTIHLNRILYLANLKESVNGALELDMTRVGSCKYMPLQLWRLFISKNPWLRALHYSVFMPSTMEVLLLLVLFLGDSAISALFHSTDGSVQSRKGRGSASCGVKGFWEELGKLVTIAMFTALVASVPVFILGYLRRREFRHYCDEASWSYSYQLYKWRCMDLQIWILGLAYMVFCSLYCSSFLANVSDIDKLKWTFSVLLTFGLQVIIVPLFSAILLGALSFFGARHAGVCALCISKLAINNADNEEIEAQSADLRAQADTLEDSATMADMLEDPATGELTHATAANLDTCSTDGTPFMPANATIQTDSEWHGDHQNYGIIIVSL